MSDNGKFSNSRKNAALQAQPKLLFETETPPISQRCKFNFHYMNFIAPALSFEECEQNGQLASIMAKLKHFSEYPLLHWRREPIGTGKGHVLEIYGDFPRPSKNEYKYPKNVPADALWGRFRINQKFRLVGFVIPDELHGKKGSTGDFLFDKNTFYCVFLDPNHQFWKVKP